MLCFESVSMLVCIFDLTFGSGTNEVLNNFVFSFNLVRRHIKIKTYKSHSHIFMTFPIDTHTFYIYRCYHYFGTQARTSQTHIQVSC